MINAPINQCRFCGHHRIAHLHWLLEPSEGRWLEGKCNQGNDTCPCEDYGDVDNLKFLEEKYESNSL
jgi:hypothetical protein